MTRIPTRLPAPLSGRSASLASTLLTRGGAEVDVAIGGIPFRVATFGEFPETVSTVPVQRDQFDTEQEPGEQTLSFWWRRSQDSFHEGAGSLYQESRGQDPSLASFWDSRGVDVWTRGELRLLPRMVDESLPFAASRVRTAKGGLTAVANGGLWAGPVGSVTQVFAPVAENVVDGLVTGAMEWFYALTDEAYLHVGRVVDPNSANQWLLVDGQPAGMEWGKHRLWVYGGRAIWVPDLSSPTSTDPVYVHPDPTWVYTDAAESPTGMLFVGNDGRQSSIQEITLDGEGGIPQLSGATTIAVFPDGEIVTKIAVLAGQFLGIASNKGFRVGILSGNGLFYGPVLFSQEGASEPTAVVADGRFFRVAFDGEGTFKVDTGTEIGDGVFPYARDLEPGSGGYVTSLASADGRLAVSTVDGGLWVEHPTELVDSGWLTVGRIRFRTTERKLFKSITLESEPLAGAVAVEALEESGTSIDVGTFNEQGRAGSPVFDIPAVLGPQQQMAFRFTLVRDVADPTSGPVLRSYLVRALPSVRPQREFVLPLLCYSREQGRSGVQYGHDGYGTERRRALEALEDTGDVVLLQDFRTSPPSGLPVLIESLRFVQMDPPRIGGGYGGVLVATLRTAVV